MFGGAFEGFGPGFTFVGALGVGRGGGGWKGGLLVVRFGGG